MTKFVRQLQCFHKSCRQRFLQLKYMWNKWMHFCFVIHVFKLKTILLHYTKDKVVDINLRGNLSTVYDNNIRAECNVPNVIGIDPYKVPSIQTLQCLMLRYKYYNLNILWYNCKYIVLSRYLQILEIEDTFLILELKRTMCEQKWLVNNVITCFFYKRYYMYTSLPLQST